MTVLNALPTVLMHGGFYRGGGGPVLPFLLGLLILALIGTLVWVIVSNRRKPKQPVVRPTPTPEEKALATLAQRFADGEISVEEYTERAAVLRPTPPGSEV